VPYMEQQLHSIWQEPISLQLQPQCLLFNNRLLHQPDYNIILPELLPAHSVIAIQPVSSKIYSYRSSETSFAQQSLL